MLNEGDKVKARQRIECRTATGSLRVVPAGSLGVVLPGALDLGSGPLNRAEIQFRVKGKPLNVWTFVGCVEVVS